MNKVFLVGRPEKTPLGNQSAAFCPSPELVTAAALAKLGVSTAFMTRLDGRHDAEVLKKLVTNGADTSLVFPANGAELSVADMQNTDLSEYRYVYFTGAFPASSQYAEQVSREIVKRAQQCCTPLVFDPDVGSADGSAAYREMINSFAFSAEVFVPNIDEVRQLCGLDDPQEIGSYYISRGTKKIVITLGKDGAFFMSEKESGTAPTFRADPIDTVGAGSAFAAGILSGLCEELPLSEAVVRANAMASMQIQFSGNNEIMPSMDQLRSYMLDRRFVVDGCKEI